jgi:hypothetical protein
MPYSEKNLETVPKPLMSYKELMDAGRTFTASEYSSYQGLSGQVAKRELESLVMEGKAEIVSRINNSTVYRLKPDLLQVSDPFNLIKRKEPHAEDINAWMYGAKIS